MGTIPDFHLFFTGWFPRVWLSMHIAYFLWGMFDDEMKFTIIVVGILKPSFTLGGYVLGYNLYPRSYAFALLWLMGTLCYGSYWLENKMRFSDNRFVAGWLSNLAATALPLVV